MCGARDVMAARMGRHLACWAVLSAAAIAHAETRIELRGGAPLPRGVPIAVTHDGVVFAANGSLATDGPTTLVRWDRVLWIEGDLAAAAAPYADLARLAWRARFRLERGDRVAAEPLFDRLLAATRDRPGELRTFAAEGLTRCRIARGAMVGAVDAWLIWLDVSGDAGAAGPESAVFADELSGLVPSLPPVFIASPAVAVGAERGALAEHERASRFAFWYRRAMEFEAGLLTESEAPPGPRADWAEALVADVVLARTGDSDERARARERLQSRLERPGRGGAPETGWVRAWLHAGLGRSYVVETETPLRLRGVISLLTVAASYEEALPQLAAISLAEAAVTLRALGRRDEALALRDRLRSVHHGSAVVGWDALHGWGGDRAEGAGDRPAPGGADPADGRAHDDPGPGLSTHDPAMPATMTSTRRRSER